MSRTPIQLRFDSGREAYQPGDVLEGTFSVEQAQELGIRSAEFSVLWYTAGQGEEDLAVHHFERLVGGQAEPLDLSSVRRFSTVLPRAPLSYDGLLVKVCWCARLRLFLEHGQEIVRDVAFRLGFVAGPAAAMSRDAGEQHSEAPVEGEP